MDHTQLWGGLLVVVAGLSMGGSGWPIKLMTTYRYEHFAFLSMVFNVVLIWAVTLLFCPDAFGAYRSIEPSVLLWSNLFSMLWGVANVLFYLCLIRIGFSLTGGILTGVGVSIGVITPMIFKGSGLFNHAPNVLSPAGYAIMAGVAIMLLGVWLASLAGYAKHRHGVGDAAAESSGDGFTLGLIMVIVAGVLSAGISFSFVYSQGPIVAAMKARGAADMPANVAVWAVGLAGGLLINILYPAYLLTKNKTWPVLWKSPLQIFYCLFIAIGVTAAIVFMGQGMILLGALGASVGFGVQQAMQMLGGQAVGFISGEWRGIPRKVLMMMLGAIALLIVAACIMAYGNSLAGSSVGASLLPKADFYVATDGQDSNPGTVDAPFATLARARDAVRQKVTAGLSADVLVLIRGGIYPQTETVTFGPEDSGTKDHSITYAAAPGEEATFSGGRAITGWQKGTGDIWTAEIPEVKAGKW